jgi:hypothetical protein
MDSAQIARYNVLMNTARHHRDRAKRDPAMGWADIERAEVLEEKARQIKESA